MKALLYFLSTMAVVGLAFWAYRENYTTQQALREVDRLHAEIRASHARLAVLRAEWAYLNRPDRLRELADLNFDRLALLPLRPDQFGTVADLPEPLPPAPEFDNVIELSSNTTEARP